MSAKMYAKINWINWLVTLLSMIIVVFVTSAVNKKSDSDISKEKALKELIDSKASKGEVYAIRESVMSYTESVKEQSDLKIEAIEAKHNKYEENEKERHDDLKKYVSDEFSDLKKENSELRSDIKELMKIISGDRNVAYDTNP